MPHTHTNAERAASNFPPEESAHYTCAHCHSEHESNDDLRPIGGAYYCPDCFYTCDNCGDNFTTESPDSLCLGHDIFCGEDCASNAGWIVCVDCGEWYRRGGAYIHGHGDVCDSCVDNYYACEDCGNLFSERHVEYDDRAGCYYCHDCRRAPRVVNDYSYKPRAILSKMSWENTTYLGLELEVECAGRDREELAAKLQNWLNTFPAVDGRKLSEYLYFKHDGSLADGGAGGVEIVFHPFTLKAFHAKFPLRKFMLKLKDVGFRGYQSGHCGLHVHVSRAGFKNAIAEGNRGDAAHVGKVFFYKCAPYLKKFSRRKNFDYCHFDTSMPRDGFRQDSGRYSAFNTSASARTYEIRIFRATIDYKRFLASIQFADAFAHYIPARSLAFMLNNGPAAIWQDFLDYCKKEQKWGQFISYIFRNRII